MDILVGAPVVIEREVGVASLTGVRQQGIPVALTPSDYSPVYLPTPPVNPDGIVSLVPFEYVSPTAQTTHTVFHNLGHDPVAVQVIDRDSGLLVDGFSYVVLDTNTRVRIAFDISLSVTIRLF